jgi:hypothetical protein
MAGDRELASRETRVILRCGRGPVYGRRRFLDFAVTDTGSAGAHTFSGTIDYRVHRLKVHIPASLGNVVGVTDFMPELRPTTAYFANFCHKNTLPARCLRAS